MRKKLTGIEKYNRRVVKLNETLEKIDDDEKLRLLYRIELFNLNRRLTGVLKENGMEYYSVIPELYHTFFDGNASSSNRYQKLQNMFGAKKNVCDYFDSETVYAYAMFINKFVSEYNNYGIRFSDALRRASEFIYNLFDRGDFAIQTNAIVSIDKEMRGKAQYMLMQDLGIKDLFLDEMNYNSRMNAIDQLRLEEVEREKANEKPKFSENGYALNDAGEEISVENGYTEEDEEDTREL